MTVRVMSLPRDFIDELVNQTFDDDDKPTKQVSKKQLFFEEPLLKSVFLNKWRSEQEKKWNEKTDLEKMEFLPGLDEELDVTIQHRCMTMKYCLDQWVQKELEEDIDIEVVFHVRAAEKAGKRLLRGTMKVKTDKDTIFETKRMDVAFP